VISVLIRHKFH